MIRAWANRGSTAGICFFCGVPVHADLGAGRGELLLRTARDLPFGGLVPSLNISPKLDPRAGMLRKLAVREGWAALMTAQSMAHVCRATKDWSFVRR